MTLCYFQMYSKVIPLYIYTCKYIHIHISQILLNHSLLQDIVYGTLCSNRSLLIYFICSSEFANPKLLIYLSPPFPSGNHKFVFYVCEFVSVLLICSFVSFFLDSTYEVSCDICLSLTSLSMITVMSKKPVISVFILIS